MSKRLSFYFCLIVWIIKIYFWNLFNYNIILILILEVVVYFITQVYLDLYFDAGEENTKEYQENKTIYVTLVFISVIRFIEVAKRIKIKWK